MTELLFTISAVITTASLSHYLARPIGSVIANAVKPLESVVIENRSKEWPRLLVRSATNEAFRRNSSS